MPSVAVIVTTYNSPTYLHKVLNGYSEQSRFPDELIVADDGSTAETAELVAAFARRSPFEVRHVWHEDQGFRAAKIRNEATKVSRSDYLVFSDGDCVPHPDFIADHLALCEEGFFVTGKRMLVGQNASANFRAGHWLKMALLSLRGELSGAHHLLRTPGISWRSEGLRGVKGCNLAIFRRDVVRVNGYDENYTGWGREDSDLVARLFKAGLKRKVAPFCAMLFHLWHPENSRANLERNDEILKRALKMPGYACENGLVKGGMYE